MSFETLDEMLIDETATDSELIAYLNKVYEILSSYREDMNDLSVSYSVKNNIRLQAKKYFEICSDLAFGRTNPEITELMNSLQILHDEYQKITTKANDGALALQMLMNDQTFARINEIEKEIMFRRFYFPGGVPELIIVNESDFAAYDEWDPRVMQDYIIRAKQRGFHRYFIIYDSNNMNYRTSNFGEADKILNMSMDWIQCTWDSAVQTDTAVKQQCSDILAGLIYFGKLDVFLKEFDYPCNNKTVQKVRTNLDDILSAKIKKIQLFIGQTQKNFVNDNIGWTAYDDNSFAFDCEKLLPEWLSLQQKYEEYKNKVFEILQDLEALQLCTNYVNAYGNNLYINQGISCAQTVIKQETHVEINPESDEDGNEEEDKNAEKEPEKVVITEPPKIEEEVEETPVEPPKAPEDKHHENKPHEDTPSETQSDNDQPVNAPPDQQPTPAPTPPEPENKPPETPSPTPDEPENKLPETPAPETPPEENKKESPDEDLDKDTHETTPFYKQTWFIVTVIIVVVITFGIIITVFVKSSGNGQIPEYPVEMYPDNNIPMSPEAMSVSPM